MNDSCQRFAAALRDNGEVLITDSLETGSSTSGLYAAELYDSSTGSFTVVGNMIDARSAHTPTLLQNGQVLIVGEFQALAPSFTGAELYSPSTNSFSATGSLIDARAYQTATQLSGGKILIAGQDPTGNSLDTAELYDPGAGTFSATGSMRLARQSQRATALNNREVPITGGEKVVHSTAAALDTAELYNPSTGKFTKAGTMADGGVFQTATLRRSGEVLIAGGRGSDRQSSRLGRTL